MASAGDVMNAISTAELERRWAAVRAAMDDRDIDILVMQNSNSFHGGYVKWFTDIPAMNGGYQAVLFPKNDRMIAVRHGPPGVSEVKEDDPINRGVARIHSQPTFAAVDFTKDYAAGAVLEELRPRADKTIGLVGTTSMAYPFLEGIKNGSLGNSKFVDATDMVDQIKAIKSEEEIEFIKRAAAMQDASMAEVFKQIKPGMKNLELTALAQYSGQLQGSEQGLFLAGSAPPGTPGPKMGKHMQAREIQEGDQFTLLIENNGPGGFYTELGRTCVLGKASQELKDEFEFTLEAQKFTLEMIKPGAEPKEILLTYNDFMRKNGRPEELRLYAHGQGYDLVERPIIRAEEKMALAPNMSIVVHPTYATDTAYSWVCDNYLVTGTGVSACIHETPQKIFEL
ncbi:MAG: M24 family metallopeptidase [Rhodospirillales bacterium]|jgi:Xaa-Pro aminopeptidase|nr:M24 family metallopeptidase [Rhodospirillales bacterium]